MKILGICLSPGKGGLELYAHKAITALHAAGHECYFVLSPASYLKQRDWAMAVLELQPTFRHLPVLAARKLAHYIDVHQIDIVHMHWNKDLNLVALAKLFSRRKPKLVYSRHMEITRSKKDFYHRLLYGQVDQMLVISKFVLEQAIRYLPLSRERISLLYLGVKEATKVEPQQCAELMPGLFGKENDFVIGMIGRIEPYKGQHVLLEALTILKRQNLQPKVAIAGPIMDKVYFDKLLQQIQEEELESDAKYLGVTDEPEKLMSCCDVVVLTTYCETFGLVLVEAMRAGTAVIGTNAGGVPEIIKHDETGLLYEPGNAGQLAGLIEELYQDKSKRMRLAATGKEFADKMFAEGQHYDNLEKIILKM
jgi:glycosyltransferase involved in cell wall biosynthesis